MLVGLLLLAAVAAAPAPATPPSVTRPPQFNASERCLTRAERRKAFWFRASDRTRLAGVVLGEGPRGLVLAHQGGGNLCNWFPYARSLARSGFHVIAFDFRAYGASDIPSAGANVNRFDLDVVAAVKILRKRGAKRVVLAGASLGATTVVVVAAQLQPPVNAVVSLSGSLQVYNLDAGAAVRRLQVAALFVAAEDDPGFVGATRSLYADTAASDKQLVVLPQGGHGTSLLRLPAFRSTLTGFFRAHT
jgi:pimeloyl-ACP methyl ester carboxylesterase